MDGKVKQFNAYELSGATGLTSPFGDAMLWANASLLYCYAERFFRQPSLRGEESHHAVF
jgi:hypothetical protein